MPPERTSCVGSHPCQGYRRTSCNGWDWMLLSTSSLKFRQLEIDGANGEIIIDPIHPEMRSMPWNFYDSSARYATLLILNIIRPIPQRIMVAVSFTNVRTVRPISPRPKIPSWKV